MAEREEESARDGENKKMSQRRIKSRLHAKNNNKCGSSTQFGFYFLKRSRVDITISMPRHQSGE